MRLSLLAAVCAALQVAAKLPQAIYSNKTMATPAYNVFGVRDVLEPRQSCAPGPTCSDGGYCCTGDACCGSGGCVPDVDTCCSGGYGCQPGYYCCGNGCAPEDGDCCGDGGHCPSGDTCTQQNCDYEWCCDGPNQSYGVFSYSYTLPGLSYSYPAPQSTSAPASNVASSSYNFHDSSSTTALGANPSFAGGVYKYYYTTFTFYFWVYYATTIQQTATVTSTRTTTETLISVYASNQNAADQQFTSLESIAKSAASAAASYTMPAMSSQPAPGGAARAIVGPAGPLVDMLGVSLAVVAGCAGMLALAL